MNHVTLIGRVSPAPAGMIPNYQTCLTQLASEPRTRGDDPDEKVNKGEFFM